MKLLPLVLLLSGCLMPGEVFYTGALSDHDQALFAKAAAREGVEVVDWPMPGSWAVAYGSPQGNAAETRPLLILIDKNLKPIDPACPRDQTLLVILRHEIHHAKGNLGHSDNPDSFMHDPVPCWPTD